MSYETRFMRDGPLVYCVWRLALGEPILSWGGNGTFQGRVAQLSDWMHAGDWPLFLREVRSLVGAGTGEELEGNSESYRAHRLVRLQVDGRYVEHHGFSMRGEQSDEIVTWWLLADPQGISLANVNRQLLNLAYTDDLTQLFNRRKLRADLERELERARRYHFTLGLLSIDIDGFKQINDTHGHACGDAVLQHCADLLRTHIRSSDMAYRVGGEEFVVLLPHTDAGQALVLAERLRVLVRQNPVVYRTGPISWSISLGVATAGADGSETIEGLLCQADRALYRAKQNGRDQISLGRGGMSTSD